MDIQEATAEPRNDLLDSLDEKARLRAISMRDLHTKYLFTARDRELDVQIGHLIETAAVDDGGHGDPLHAVAIIGGTGAGKSTAVRRSIQSRVDILKRPSGGSDEETLIFVRTPSPCTVKLLGHEMLDQAGYPFQRDIREGVAWRILRHHLKTRRIRFIYIDEAQHMLNMTDRKAMKRLADALKSLMEDDEWPVRFIFSGMPEFADFLTIHPELRRRCATLHFQKLDSERDRDLLAWIVREIVEKHAGMVCDFVVDADFLGRLCHASGGEFGATTQIVRGAIARVLIDDVSARKVCPAHFRKAYEIFSGCRREQNVFGVSDWRTIEPLNSLLRDEELARTHVLRALEERQAKLDGRPVRKKKGEAA